MIDFVRRGYNRDGDDLAQVNLLMITSEHTHLPVYYRILSGSIRDVSALKESIRNLKLLGTNTVRLIMDKGFYSDSPVSQTWMHYTVAGISSVSACHLPHLWQEMQ